MSPDQFGCNQAEILDFSRNTNSQLHDVYGGCQTKLEPHPRVGLHKRWKVRRCMNNECERVFWQRDVNAAINLAKFFLWEVNGEDKDEIFRRPCRLDEEDVPDV